MIKYKQWMEIQDLADGCCVKYFLVISNDCYIVKYTNSTNFMLQTIQISFRGKDDTANRRYLKLLF